MQQPLKTELSSIKQKNKALKSELRDLKSQHVAEMQKLISEN